MTKKTLKTWIYDSAMSALKKFEKDEAERRRMAKIDETRYSFKLQ
jgi:hypothetical protein